MSYPGKLGLIQRVLPSYRVPFFDALAAACVGGLSLFAGLPREDETIAPGRLQVARQAPARNLHFGSPSSSLYFCYQRGLLEWLAGWDLEANFRYLSTPAGVRWMHARRRPVLGWGLGAPAGRGPLTALRRSFLLQFDALIAYSARGADQYAACGFPADRILVARNAVAPAPVHLLPARPGHFDPRPVVLFVGRLQPRKRLPALFAACAGLPEPLKPRLVVVGDGPELDRLRTQAASVYPATEFVGAKHGAQLDPFFRAADLFVLPGTGGLAVQEAMSFGLPVIVAQGDGTQDDLVRPENGWQVPPDDDAALAAALRQALSDVARLRTMGAESYRIVAEEINLGKMVDVFTLAIQRAGASLEA